MNTAAQLSAVLVVALCIALVVIGLIRFAAAWAALRKNNESAAIRADALVRCALAELEEAP